MLGTDRHADVVGRDVVQHLEHLLFALEGLEQTPKGLATPGLRLVGEVRDTADHDVGRVLSARRETQHVSDHQQQVVLIRRDRRRQLQELRLRAGIGLSLQRAEFPLRPVERLRAPVLGPVQDLLVDATVLPDREHHHRGAHVDELEPDQLLLGGARRDGDAGVLR